jgi:hypothetical protein
MASDSELSEDELDVSHGERVRYHCYTSKHERYPFDSTDEERAETMRAMRDNATLLRSLYDRGVPFFSKQIFRGLVSQLDHGRANPRPATGAEAHVIRIPTVDESFVECELEVGRVVRLPVRDQPQSPDTEIVMYGIALGSILQ